MAAVNTFSLAYNLTVLEILNGDRPYSYLQKKYEILFETENQAMATQTVHNNDDINNCWDVFVIAINNENVWPEWNWTVIT